MSPTIPQSLEASPATQMQLDEEIKYADAKLNTLTRLLAFAVGMAISSLMYWIASFSYLEVSIAAGTASLICFLMLGIVFFMIRYWSNVIHLCEPADTELRLHADTLTYAREDVLCKNYMQKVQRLRRPLSRYELDMLLARLRKTRNS